jgi:hypothetical protein
MTYLLAKFHLTSSNVLLLSHQTESYIQQPIIRVDAMLSTRLIKTLLS